MRLKNALLFLVIAACGAPRGPGCGDRRQARGINEARDRALAFLEGAQRPWGEFEAPACLDRAMQIGCRTQSSVFPTAVVLSALVYVDHPVARRIYQKGLDFLTAERRSDGTWGYAGSRAGYWIQSDVDDTALASFALAKAGRDPDSRARILENRNAAGVLRTWMADPGPKPRPNDLDCVVNANALLYLGELPEFCHYVNESIAKYAKECSIYYLDELALIYAASRAFRESSPCLEPSRAAMLTFASRRRERGDGPLERALALNTRLNLGGSPSGFQNEINELLDAQDPAGAWPAAALYCVDCRAGDATYYGAREITTAIVLEALAKGSL